MSSKKTTKLQESNIYDLDEICEKCSAVIW